MHSLSRYIIFIKSKVLTLDLKQDFKESLDNISGKILLRDNTHGKRLSPVSLSRTVDNKLIYKSYNFATFSAFVLCRKRLLKTDATNLASPALS